MYTKRRHHLLCLFCQFLLFILIMAKICYGISYDQSYELIEYSDDPIIYRLTISISEILYEYYERKDHNLYQYDFSKFVTPDTLKPVAEDLWNIYDNEEDFANGVLMIVHQIPYLENDPQKYPIETIVENKGDCDILSVLAASIMKSGGLDTVILFQEYQDHIQVGVNLSESPKYARSQIYFYRYEGKKYYVAETTGGNWKNGWRVGECPETLQKATAKIIPLNNYEQKSIEYVSSRYTNPDSSSINISSSTYFILSQNNIEISGRLIPSSGGESVKLYVNQIGSSSTILKSVITDSNGQYSYSWDPPTGGIYTLKTEWIGNDDYNSTNSSTIRIVVLSWEMLILIIIPILLIILIIVTQKRMNNVKH